MASSNGEATTGESVRCRVCGREFEDDDELEHHVRDQGLLW